MIYEIPSHVATQLKEFFNQFDFIDKVVVFGSRARHDCTPKSDIDLCIYSLEMTDIQFSKLKFEIDELPILYKLDVVHFEKVNKELQDNVERDGKLLFIKEVILNEIVDLQNGYAFKSIDYVDFSNTLSCRMSNIRPNGIFDLNYNLRFLPDSYSEKYKDYLLKDNDLIIAMTDLANESRILGVPVLVKTENKNVLQNQRVGKLILKVENVYIPYLMRVLSTKRAREFYKKFSNGGLQINIGKNEILENKIPLPTLTKQKKIANILDKASELITLRKESIQKLDELSKSIFIDMFGDPISNPKKWNTKKLGKITDVKTGKTPSRKEKKYWENGTEYWATTTEVNKKNIYDTEEKITKYAVEKCKLNIYEINTILIAMYGQGKTRGNVALLKIKSTINQAFGAILPSDDINYLFLFNLLKNSYSQIRSLGRGGNQENLNLDIVKNIEIILPPLELQNKFATIIEKIEEQKALYEKELKLLENNFDSLLDESFN